MHIFRREPASIKGKAIRRKPQAIGAMPLVEILATILNLHPTVTLSMDCVFIQGIPMLHSISSGYTFRAIEVVRVQKPNKKITVEAASKVVNIYKARGLQVAQINADNEFECIQEDMRPIPMNIVAVGEHVGYIERSNWKIKERRQCHVH